MRKHGPTESKRSAEVTDDDDGDTLRLEDRPSTLPPKDPAEHKRQLQQYQKLRAHAVRMAEAERADQARREERKSHAQTAWLNEIIPNWQSALKSGHAREACRDGIPPSVRVFAWPLMLRNALNITPGMSSCIPVYHYDSTLMHVCATVDLYNICREKARSLLFTPVADDTGAASSINREDTYVRMHATRCSGCPPTAWHYSMALCSVLMHP